MRRNLFLLFVCAYLFVPVFVAHAETDAERRARLEQELQAVERQILTQERLVEDKQAERQSLERDINIIEGKISKAQLGIKAREIAITQLSDQIGEKEIVLQILSERLNRQEQSLADLVRKAASMEDFSLIEILLSKKSFS